METGQTRCWLVPDALADRLDDLDGGVALWLHELQRLAQPTSLGWDPSLKIVSPGTADLDSGCFDSGDDESPLARSKRCTNLSDTVVPMDSDDSTGSCSECSSEDSLEGEEWCLPQETRALPALLEVDEEEEEEVQQQKGRLERRFGDGSTEIILWDDSPLPCDLPNRSRSEGELADRTKPRFFHTTRKPVTLFDIFPFDLFDPDFPPVRQATFDEVETEVLNISEEMRQLCQTPVQVEERTPHILDNELLALLSEAGNFADECLSDCSSPVHHASPSKASIFDTGDSLTPPIPPVRRKKIKRPARAATSDELLLLTRATERSKLKRSRSLSGDTRRSEVTPSKVVTSDLLEWKRHLLWSALLSDEDEDDMIIADMKMDKWFSSSDGKGHVYYFEENSNESSWTLPEVSSSPHQGQEAEQDTIQQDDVEAHVQEVSDDEDADVPPKTLASELAAQLAKRCRASPESNLQTRDKIVRRAAKSRSMILIDCDLKDVVPKDVFPKEVGPPKNWPQLSEGAMNVLKEGTLNRTKITENGKKLRKNWASSHVVLTELCLLLFRDAKTFAAMKAADKNPGTNAPRPELSMDLNGASIDRADRPDKLFATSRKNVFLVSTVLGLQVLFQCECSSQTDEWFKAVQAAIKKLPCGLDSCPRKESDRLISGPYSPEQNKKFPRIGRSKSVKLKSKDGSIEDLTVSTAERQTKIRARLKKFFNRRPTMESLVKKGIWKDEPAFGCFLEQACGTESPRVPVFVQKCIAVIESKVDNMKTDGLYRASGNLSQVQKIRLQVDQNNLAVLEQEEDVHVLTGTLKLFFRELKEPLIPYASFSKAIKASMNHSKKEKIAQFREIIKSLPVPNHDTLKFLLKHLLRVTSYQEFNRMHIPNLAIVFGPTLMWPEQESLNMALDLMQQNLVIETLLLDFEAIFR